MDRLTEFLSALAGFATLAALFHVSWATLLGIFVGSLPGLTATMCVALLTTLYGAMLANMVALPIADKLNLRKAEEGRIKSMCIDGILAIQQGQNPRIIESMLKAYLEPKKRKDDSDGAAEAA